MTDASRTLSAADIFTGSYDTIIDTRSPAEFAQDHVPGALNCPVLSDAERAAIGTLYKQTSPFEARKQGAILTARNIATAIETHFLDRPKNWRPLVYCWRGGQRSSAMQIILREIGWNALKLDGGYKAWRRHVLTELDTLPTRFRYIVIGGPTGSGKTRLLHAIARIGAQVIDLEHLAGHKGSVLGRAPHTVQPARPLFDTRLYTALRSLDPARPVFIEDESARIGDIHLPGALTRAIGSSPVIPLAPTMDARIDFLLTDYDYFLTAPDELKQRLSALRPLHPRDRFEDWMSLVDEGGWPALTRELLIHHYDPLYARGAARRTETRPTLKTIAPPALDPDTLDRLARDIVNAATIPQ